MASDSDSTDRSHIVTGAVHANATTANAAGQRARLVPATVHTEVASATQQATATAACQFTYARGSNRARDRTSGAAAVRGPAQGRD
jgi:hypothetical protein